MKNRAACFVAVCGVVAFLGASPAFAQIQVGKPVVAFNLQDLDGNWHSTAQYRDKVLVLWFIGYN